MLKKLYAKIAEQLQIPLIRGDLVCLYEAVSKMETYREDNDGAMNRMDKDIKVLANSVKQIQQVQQTQTEFQEWARAELTKAVREEETRIKDMFMRAIAK